MIKKKNRSTITWCCTASAIVYTRRVPEIQTSLAALTMEIWFIFVVLLFSSVWQFHENCNYRPMGLRQPWLDDDCSLSSFFLIFFFFVLLFHSSPLSALEMMEITTKHHHLEFRLVARIVSTASSFSECEGRDICSDRVDDHNNFGTRKLWTLSEFTWS